ncbi:MAG: hypothetical protein JXQ77_03140 [Campylobacterales bacterium]|nr:hypothetical protein [Campylobacterales bacterium]
MKSVSIGEIQKNISLITKLTQSIMVVDKRKNKTIAIINPIQENSTIAELAGKYANRGIKADDLDSIKSKVMSDFLREKYGLSD